MPSEILLRFNSVPQENEGFALGTFPLVGVIFPSFVEQKTRRNEVTRGFDPISQRAKFRSAFIQDFNIYNQFELIDEASGNLGTGLDSLRIIYKDAKNVFSLSTDFTDGDITIVEVLNPDPLPGPVVTDINYQDNNCLTVETSITFENDVESITIDGQTIDNPSNPLIVEFQRGRAGGIFYSMLLNEFIVNSEFLIPDIWTIGVVDVIRTSSGYLAEININNSGDFPNIYEYSLNNEDNYAQSNSFPNLELGSYTIYVRDQYGCSQNKEFEVAENPFSSINDNIIIFPIDNSFHITIKEEIDNCETYQNTGNTLSINQNNHTRNRFFHLIQKCDCINTQFLSNYDSFEANLVNKDSIEPIVVVQKTNNLGLIDIRDGIVVSYNGKLAFYFNGGNVYSTETGLATGDNFITNDVAIFHSENTTVDIEDIGTVRIDNIDIIDDLNVFAAVTTIDYNEATVSKKITTVYNIKDTEVYEFQIDFENKEGKYEIQIEATKGDVVTKAISEPIFVKEVHEGTHEIIYRKKNNKNTLIDYRTGIYHKLRLPYDRRSIYSPNDENTVYIKDTTVESINSVSYKGAQFFFLPVPEAISEKLDKALTMDQLYIDRYGYVRDTTPENQHIGGRTDLYVISPVLRNTFRSLQGLSKDLVRLTLIEDSNADETFISEFNGSGFLAMNGSNNSFLLSQESGSLLSIE